MHRQVVLHQVQVVVHHRLQGVHQAQAAVHHRVQAVALHQVVQAHHLVGEPVQLVHVLQENVTLAVPVSHVVKHLFVIQTVTLLLCLMEQILYQQLV